MAPQTTDPVGRIFTATLVMGVSGSGKTSLLATFADYLWDTYQKVLVLYSWDGGAIPTDIQKRMKQGLIRFLRCRTRSESGLALETLYYFTKGYLPQMINPLTGEMTPAVRLVAPVSTKYALSCPEGHALKTVPAASLVAPTFCSACKLMIGRESIKVQESVERTKGFEQIGGVAYDGLTSMTGVVMDSQDVMRGQGMIGGEKSSFGGVITSGSVKFGGNNRADVGFAQTRALQFVNNALSIPYLVEGPVFTGLSTEGTDKGSTVVGVDLPGQAALTQAPAWFGNICEAETLTDDDGKEHFALRVKPFTDSLGRRHLLKTSASAVGPVPDILIDPPKDAKQPFMEFNLGVLFSLLDQDLRIALKDEVAGAPGLPSGMVEYGDGLAIEPAQPAAAGTTAGIPAMAPTPMPATPTAQPARPVAPLATPRPRPRAAAAASPVPTAAAPTVPPTSPTPAPETPAAAPTEAAPTSAAPVAPPPPVVAKAPAAVPIARAQAQGTASPPPPGPRPPARMPGR